MFMYDNHDCDPIVVVNEVVTEDCAECISGDNRVDAFYYLDNNWTDYKPIEETEVRHDLVKVAHDQVKLGMFIFAIFFIIIYNFT